MANQFNVLDGSPYDRTFGHNFFWCVPNLGYSLSSVVAIASQYRVMRFQAPRNMTVVKIGFCNPVAATTDDAVDVGLFTVAGVKIVSSGATSGKANATAGAQTISITPTLLVAGTVYYVGLAYGTVGGTAATLSTFTPASAQATKMGGTGLGSKETSTNAGATLPDPIIVTGDASGGAVYALAVLES